MGFFFFFFQAEDGIRDKLVTGVQTCALPIFVHARLVPLLAVLAAAPQGGHRVHTPPLEPRERGHREARGEADVEPAVAVRSEEHTSELQSLAYLVCRLLLEKKKKNIKEFIRQLRAQ